jgi:hypothetical protein
MKKIDASYLYADSPADRGVRFFLDPAEPDIVRVEVDIDPPGAGTLKLRLGVNDLLKLAARMHAVGMRARGAAVERGPAN